MSEDGLTTDMTSLRAVLQRREAVLPPEDHLTPAPETPPEQQPAPEPPPPLELFLLSPFRLPAQSPALKLGFVPLDIGRVGPRQGPR